jgi:protein-S-isoprenylcysteine O-methyltransferase Ste14
VPLYRTSGLAAGLLVASLVIAGVVEFRQSGREREDATSQDRGSRRLLSLSRLIGMIGAVVVVYAVPGADIHRERGLAFGIGLLVLWSGAALRWWAFHTLGRYFTFTVMTDGDQPVITDGPYRLVRHPGYAGAMLVRAGFGLALGNWLSVALAVVVPLIGVIYRIGVEEAALFDALGDNYRSYAAERKRLIPFVW